MPVAGSTKYIIAFILMLLAAFVQCYITVHGLHWASEPDFDRDIAYIRTTLNGHYGTDPNYVGQYMWYNPMIFLSETICVKLTGLPINIIVARAGVFLNIINPIIFFWMVVKLFDYKIALASLLAYLFLVNGNLPCWGAATYSPWMISDTFVQFLFFINIFLVYKSFSTQSIIWFILLGCFLGLSFLGHSAPTIIIILILIYLQFQKIIMAIWDKAYNNILNYILQGLFTLIPFLIFAFPFLYYVMGKYHFHFVNRVILQCAPGIFARPESFNLIKANITICLFVSILGAIWFYRRYTDLLIRKIIVSWLVICAVLYMYESVLPTMDKLTHINFPDTIPAFHYFFYLKAVQAIFFGFGFMYLFNLLLRKLQEFNKTTFTTIVAENILILTILLYSAVYYPFYSHRNDFSELRQAAIIKGNEKDKIDIYNFIEKNIPLNNVMLCNHGLSLFPVMPTGIKMVSVEVYFSNPYISYDQRESDRNAMLSYLTTSAPASARSLFGRYKVNYVLLQNEEFTTYKFPAFASNKIVFKNSSYTIIALDKAKS
jgi:hypothetical protein